MKKVDLSQWISTLAGLVLAGGVLIGAFWLVGKAIERGATIVAAILAALATIVGAFIVRYWDRKKEGEAARREHLGKLYEQLGAVLAGQEIPQRKLEKTLLEFMRKVVVYASPAVIKAFRDWRVNLPEDDAPREEVAANMLRYEALVKAMRADLGTSNWGLEEGELLRAVLNDFDDYFAPQPEELAPPEGEPTVTSTKRGSAAKSG